MLKRAEMQKRIENLLSVKPTTENNNNVFEYKLRDKSKNCTIYFEKKTHKERIIVHPDWQYILESQPIDGILFQNGNSILKNSNFLDFPPPQGPSKDGCALVVRDPAALEALLVRIGALQAFGSEKAPAVANTEVPASHPATPSETGREAAVADAIQPSEPDKAAAFADVEAAAPQLADLPETEREAVIAARIGQGRFRAALMSAWLDRCAVTGNDIHDLLRASHIKPWRDSDNGERLDTENGLLLVATLDAAFDAGLISFENDGTMLLSPGLGPDPHKTLGIPAGSSLAKTPSPRQRTFLDHHRKAVFR